MKKIFLVMAIALLTLCGCAQEPKTEEKQEEMKMDVEQTHKILRDEGPIQYLDVVTNTSKITDKEACAREIIEHCIKNDFPGVRFSYDLSGYPIEIHASVYLNEEDADDGKSVFEMTYKQDADEGYRYNIKDHPEEFTLKITERK